jgi:hypothetical protein
MDPLPAPRLAETDLTAEPDPAARQAAVRPTIAYAPPMVEPTPDEPDHGDEDAPGHIPEPRAYTAEDEREAIARLSRLNGPGELRAAILALLQTPGSRRERRAWQEETSGLSTARGVRDETKKLSPATRLPWLELLVDRVATAPLGDRQHLLASARRMMSADGQVRPIDRLHLLLLRQRLGEAAPVKPAADAQNDLAQSSLHTRREIARFTAFLARLMPEGPAWYTAVMQPWLSGESLPPCEAPDADGLVHALQELQALPWMLRPVLVRAWTEAALTHKPPGPLPSEAADALRLASALLDSPLPPELAKHYVEPAAP